MDSNRALPTSGLLLVFAVVAGLFLYNTPLKRLRPAKPDPIPSAAVGEELLDARLWQDPFGPLVEWKKRKDARDPTRELHVRGDNSVLIPIITRGGAYAEDKEFRIRSRYALIRALGSEKFFASDPEKIGLSPLEGDAYAPYEWFDSSSSQFDRALVVWLSDRELGDRPLTNIATICTDIAPIDSVGAVLLLGPPSSDILAAMLDEAVSLPDSTVREFWESQKTRIHSPWATAPDRELLKGVTKLASDAKSVEKAFGAIEFQRFVQQDDSLVVALAKDLCERIGPKRTLARFGPTNGNGSVAIVTEFDTLYGRSLAVLLENELKKTKLNLDLHLATYLRGIDGIRSSAPEQKTDEPSPQALIFDATTERAHGEAQLDYLGRLARGLQTLNAEAQRFGGRGIEAVGVMGTDVYDKLLVLQALRPRFRNAVFFTTDLDARFLESRHYDYTRNLIVASSYDLVAPEESAVDGDVPRFRDNYQTALYVAARAGLREETASLKSASVFEIGRTGAIQLGRTRHPFLQGKHLGPVPVELAAVVITLLGGFLLSSLSGELRYLNPRSWRDDWNRERGIIYYSTFLALCTIYALGMSSEEEPFEFFEGVSVWPTLLVRTLLLGLTIFLFLKASRDLQRSRSDLETDFQLGAETWSRPHTFERNPDEKRVIPLDCWKSYMQEASRRAPFLWSVVAAAGLGLALIFTFGRPFVPARGETATWAELVLSWAASLALLALTLYVLHAARACSRFIQALTRARSYWPERAIRERLRGRGHYSGMEEWMDIRLIARRTEVLEQLILYPFLAITIHILAHSTLFDDWRLTTTVLLIFGPIATLAIANMVILRRVAQLGKHRALHRVQRLALRAAGSTTHSKAEVDALATAIEEEDAGVFRPLSRHPILGALLLPFSGMSVLALIELLTRS